METKRQDIEAAKVGKTKSTISTWNDSPTFWDHCRKLDKKLSPCPFCGSGAVVEFLLHPPTKSFWAECDLCGAKTDIALTGEEAADLWNTRHQPSVSGDAVREAVDMGAVADVVHDALIVTVIHDYLDYDGSGLGLVDRLSPDEDTNIKRGTEELAALEDYIAGALDDYFKKPSALSLPSVSSEWMAIETVEDLPKEDGQVLWRYRESGQYTVQYFERPQMFNASGEYWVASYSHWRPITPPVQENR